MLETQNPRRNIVQHKRSFTIAFQIDRSTILALRRLLGLRVEPHYSIKVADEKQERLNMRALFFRPCQDVSVHHNGQAFEKMNSVCAMSTQLCLVLLPILSTGTKYYDPKPARA